MRDKKNINHKRPDTGLTFVMYYVATRNKNKTYLR